MKNSIVLFLYFITGNTKTHVRPKYRYIYKNVSISFALKVIITRIKD
jgi:hypothetical protein